MGAADWIVIAVLALILGGAGLYIFKARKSGAKCVGCPHAKTCTQAKLGECQCNTKKG